MKKLKSDADKTWKSTTRRKKTRKYQETLMMSGTHNAHSYKCSKTDPREKKITNISWRSGLVAFALKHMGREIKSSRVKGGS
jgi:hypothetical protein